MVEIGIQFFILCTLVHQYLVFIGHLETVHCKNSEKKICMVSKEVQHLKAKIVLNYSIIMAARSSVWKSQIDIFFV